MKTCRAESNGGRLFLAEVCARIAQDKFKFLMATIHLHRRCFCSNTDPLFARRAVDEVDAADSWSVFCRIDLSSKPLGPLINGFVNIMACRLCGGIR